MGIPIGEQGGSSGPPSIKLKTINDYVDFMLIDERKVPAYIYGTREQDQTQSGKPKTQDRLTVLALRGNAVINVDGTERLVEEGDVCSIYCEGQTRWDPDLDKLRAPGDFKSWSSAKEDHGPLEVGDVGRWKFDSEIQGKGAQPRKVRIFKLRRAKPDEAQFVARCAELHRQGVAITIGGGDNAHQDDAPF